MILLSNVSRWHMNGLDPAIILNNVSLAVEAHERIGILALAGSGKTTITRLLSGVERPDRGFIRRTTSLSFPLGSTDGFHEGLTGAENIRHLAQLLQRDIAETVDYVESFADIGKNYTRAVGNYSPAMRARLGFALSMAVEYDTYLSDGVTSSGDHLFKDKCEAALHERLSRSGIILLSRHARTLNRFCTRFFALHEGQLIECDTAEEAKDLLDYAGAYGDTFWNEEARVG